MKQWIRTLIKMCRAADDYLPFSDPSGETGGGEGGGVELLKSLLVEGVLEVLEGHCM
jgi:hypothetical protein